MVETFTIRIYNSQTKKDIEESYNRCKDYYPSKNAFLMDCMVRGVFNVERDIFGIKNVKDIDLVTEDIKNVASQKFKDEYVEIEKNAKLSFWDKAVRSMGFENKNLKNLKEEQDKFKKNKGLELLKNDSPELFNDKNLKIKNIIENYQAKANKTLSGKTFWSTLAMNMIMVALSCYALNWAHPRINSYIEAHKAGNKKVEVA